MPEKPLPVTHCDRARFSRLCPVARASFSEYEAGDEEMTGDPRCLDVSLHLTGAARLTWIGPTQVLV
jgi:hypothetical protein